ncbi:hypothetical protein VKS41_000733 [Umbelopsis sp. WA50703]
MSRRRKWPIVILPILLLLVIYHLIAHTYIITDIGYLARPIWQDAPQTWEIIPHYYTEGISMDTACQLHDWGNRTTDPPKIIDAVIFSVELDMYEIRLRELWDVVDKFLILESNSTFTGEPKPFTFSDHQERFAFAKDKLEYRRIYQYRLPEGETPFYNENEMRKSMNEHLQTLAKTDDLILMTDVDEIPRANTLGIIKSCSGVPSPLHLQLRNYLYSYEFPLDMDSWRARIERYNEHTTTYSHGQVSRDILADAGWHCSFCFRTIKEFVFKMTSYSHADRVRSPEFLTTEYIQDIICQGKDIFGMFPEVYSYKDLIAKWDGAEKSPSAVGLPKPVFQDTRFSFLLPGHCKRLSDQED